MAALPRSETSFRRQGSSGLVWDDKLLSGELTKIATKSEQDKHHHSSNSSETKTTTSSSNNNQRSNRPNGGGGGGRSSYRSTNVAPSADPPSPKVSGCCGVFGKPVKPSSQQPQKSGGRRRKS